jgi:hypothetical protein
MTCKNKELKIKWWWKQFDVEAESEITTSPIPNYMSVLIGTQILMNQWRIYKNTQLGPNPNSNQLSNKLFCTKSVAVNKNIWWFG